MNDAQPITPQNVLISTRIIVGALAMSAIPFTGVSVFINLTEGPLAQDDQLRNILLIVAAAVFPATIAAAFIAAKALTGQAARASAAAGTPEAGEQAIAQHYAQSVIVRGALAEGPTILCIVTFLLTGFWPALVGLLIGLTLLAIAFPTRERYARFTGAALGVR